MASFYRTRAIWTGFPGAPGYTNWAWTPLDGDTPPLASSVVDLMATFFDGIKGLLPQDVTVTVQPQMTVHDVDTGDQTGIQPSTDVPAGSAGQASGPYSAVSGACVSWLTAVARNGRMVRGRSYIVPLAGNGYDATGTLAGSTITTLMSAAQAAAGDVDTLLAVWSPPSPSGSPAAISAVDQVLVNDKVCYLSSRRD